MPPLTPYAFDFLALLKFAIWGLHATRHQLNDRMAWVLSKLPLALTCATRPGQCTRRVHRQAPWLPGEAAAAHSQAPGRASRPAELQQDPARPRLTTAPSPGAPGTCRSPGASLSVPRGPTYHGSDCPSPSLSQAPGDSGPEEPTDPRTCRPTDVELPGSGSRDTRNQAVRLRKIPVRRSVLSPAPVSKVTRPSAPPAAELAQVQRCDPRRAWLSAAVAAHLRSGSESQEGALCCMTAECRRQRRSPEALSDQFLLLAEKTRL